jgi:hypothetical protein
MGNFFSSMALREQGEVLDNISYPCFIIMSKSRESILMRSKYGLQTKKSPQKDREVRRFTVHSIGNKSKPTPTWIPAMNRVEAINIRETGLWWLQMMGFRGIIQIKPYLSDSSCGRHCRGIENARTALGQYEMSWIIIQRDVPSLSSFAQMIGCK